MENNSDKKIISVRIKRKPEPQEEPNLLYSKEDVRKFVSEFVSSWIRGDIIIRFPTASELAKQDSFEHCFSDRPVSER